MCAVDSETRSVVEEVTVAWASDADARSPEAWTIALDDLITGLPKDLRSRVAHVSVGGTSATSLLVDTNSGKVTRGVRMYNDACPSPEVASLIDTTAPAGHTVRASTSTLSKLVRALHTLFPTARGHLPVLTQPPFLAIPRLPSLYPTA